MRLAETIERWFGRVEITLAGLDDTLRAGEEALAAGDPMRARAAAHAILGRVPASPHGLALLADACEAAGLDAEAELTLEELAKRTASEPDVWNRLGHARKRTGGPADEVRDAFVRALTVAQPASAEAKEAVLALADLDLDLRDPARAELWLERLALDKSRDVALRRAEARLQASDVRGALKWLSSFEVEALDGRAALAKGRALALEGDAQAFKWLMRAAVLDAPGASELLSSMLAWVPCDAETRERVRVVVDGRGEAGLARFRAAFARAEGKPDDARAALKDAVRAHDASAARALLDDALRDGDEEGCALALSAIEGPADAVVASARATVGAKGAPEAVLDALLAIATPEVQPLADARRHAAAAAWIPERGQADWSALLAPLDAHARALHDLDATARLAALSAERGRPVRLTIVGEFNAGKSTFINALIGQEVAPMGVLPTTATLHHLRWAPDPLARIAFVAGTDPPERMVPVGDLKAVLKQLDAATVRRVEILVPIASLTRVEIIDTPGFNAPDARHVETARGAFEEADAIVWLLDAAQALKQSERLILEEARAAKLPIQVLVNKADRLGPDGVTKVMDVVRASLDEIGIASLAPPLPLSARQALAGRLGDEAALAASGWAAVQALLDEQIVARADTLKERALRRRALRAIEGLAKSATAAADAHEAKTRAAEEAARARALVAARIEGDAGDVAASIAGFLEPLTQAWQRDLDVIVTGRDADAARSDAVLARYRAERAVAHLSGPLAQALANVTKDARTTPDDFAAASRAVVRAAAGAWTGAAPKRDAVAESPALPIARAAVATAIEVLLGGANATLEPSPAAAIGRELAAVSRALSA